MFKELIRGSIIGLAIFFLFFTVMTIMLHAMDRNMVINCRTLNRMTDERPDFYVIRQEVKDCDYVGISLHATIK